MSYQKNNGSSAPKISEWKLKELMCEIGRRIWLKDSAPGMRGTIPIVCRKTGFFARPPESARASLNRRPLRGGSGRQADFGKRGRTSEILLHLFIYKNRPDVRAVIHSHPPHATAFAIAGMELPTCIHPEAEVFLGRVPTAQYVTPVTPGLAKPSRRL